MKVFMIIGKSFSGKDTVLNKILSDENFCKENNLHKYIQYTTRPKRPNETDMKDYRFITKEEFDNKRKKSDVAYSMFNSHFGEVFYLTDFSEMESNKNYIVVGDLYLASQYKMYLHDNLCLIYLIPPNYALFERFSNREDNEKFSSNKYKEICRRFLSDMILFGQRSNQIISRSNCIINLNRTIHLGKIKKLMAEFIISNQISVILNNGDVTDIDTDYSGFGFPHFEDILDGKISICNDKLIMHTEDERYIIG